MKHDLVIREHNILPHINVEEEIQLKGNGQITFTLRINGGNIVDFSVVEYVDVKKKYAHKPSTTK